MREGYIQYKGYDIPCTEETILEYSRDIYTGPFVMPYLQYKLGSLVINTAISFAEFKQSSNKDKLVDQYLTLVKLYIDQKEERNSSR